MPLNLSRFRPLLIAIALLAAPLVSLRADDGQQQQAPAANPLPDVIARAGGTVIQPERVSFSLRDLNPLTWKSTFVNGWRNGRFIATDLTIHSTWQAALARSFRPVDMGANVRAAVIGNTNPIKLAGKVFDPLGIELQRELVSGQGLDAHRLLRALDPRMIAATAVGGGVGDIAGSVLQSALARLGPVGAAAGFFLRPSMSFAGQIFGMNVGDSIVNGNMSVKGATAAALRQIKPGRDAGQLVGSVIGGTLGQVLIPIPIVGSIVGGMLGGTIGSWVGTKLAHVWPFNKLENAATAWFHHLADKLDGGEKKKDAQPAATVGPPPVSSDTTAGSAAPRPAPTALRNPLSDDGPSMADLPIASH